MVVTFPSSQRYAGSLTLSFRLYARFSSLTLVQATVIELMSLHELPSMMGKAGEGQAFDDTLRL